MWRHLLATTSVISKALSLTNKKVRRRVRLVSLTSTKTQNFGSGWQLSWVAIVLGGSCPWWQLSGWQLSRVAIVLSNSCHWWQLSRWKLSGWQLSKIVTGHDFLGSFHLHRTNYATFRPNTAFLQRKNDAAERWRASFQTLQSNKTWQQTPSWNIARRKMRVKLWNHFWNRETTKFRLNCNSTCGGSNVNCKWWTHFLGRAWWRQKSEQTHF